MAGAECGRRNYDHLYFEAKMYRTLPNDPTTEHVVADEFQTHRAGTSSGPTLRVFWLQVSKLLESIYFVIGRCSRAIREVAGTRLLPQYCD